MCRRYEIARLFFLHESRRGPLSSNVMVSPYYNMVGVAGEYNVHDAIVSEGKYTDCHFRWCSTPGLRTSSAL